MSPASKRTQRAVKSETGIRTHSPKDAGAVTAIYPSECSDGPQEAVSTMGILEVAASSRYPYSGSHHIRKRRPEPAPTAGRSLKRDLRAQLASHTARPPGSSKAVVLILLMRLALMLDSILILEVFTPRGVHHLFLHDVRNQLLIRPRPRTLSMPPDKNQHARFADEPNCEDAQEHDGYE